VGASRDARRDPRHGGGQGGDRTLGTGTIMIAALVVGVLIVGFAGQQLGARATGQVDDPGVEYPRALMDGRSIGRADAPVTLEVYEDFQCPVCARFSLTVEPTLVARYAASGVLRIVHHDIAILGRGGADDESKLAAAGAYCANEQDRYWDYAHWIYANQAGENAGAFAREPLARIAAAAGVNTSGFLTCVDSGAAVSEVATATQEALARGVNATPTLYVADQQIVGLRTAEELGRLIEAAAAAASPGSSGAASPAGSAPAASASGGSSAAP